MKYRKVTWQKPIGRLDCSVVIFIGVMYGRLTSALLFLGNIRIYAELAVQVRLAYDR